MFCRVRNCGAQGLFHETNGYCERCYEEIEAMKDKKLNPPSDWHWDPTGYYRRKAEKEEEMIPWLIWIAILLLAMVVGRSLWIWIFE